MSEQVARHPQHSDARLSLQLQSHVCDFIQVPAGLLQGGALGGQVPVGGQEGEASGGHCMKTYPEDTSGGQVRTCPWSKLMSVEYSGSGVFHPLEAEGGSIQQWSFTENIPHTVHVPVMERVVFHLRMPADMTSQTGIVLVMEDAWK